MNKNYELIEKYIQHIEFSFEKADKYISNINQDIINIDGMTSTKSRHFYNNLLNLDDARYLEIGPWKGSSVCSAMFGNQASIICIDNWSEYGGPRNEFLINFEKFRGQNKNAVLIEKDCFSVKIERLPKFNIYMYDGNYSNENITKSLTYFYHSLDDIFIFIINNWNWENVRNNIKTAIDDLKLIILYDKDIRLTLDKQHLSSQTWGNGQYIVVLAKESIVLSFNFDYKSIKTNLCDIGKKFNTYKSSQRNNESLCMPYTIFYDSIFKEKLNEKLTIAELGIFNGESLFMWLEYFPNSKIYGFYNLDLDEQIDQNNNFDRITLLNINEAKFLDVKYDIFIINHILLIDEIIRFIEITFEYLKPGGILIIENILKTVSEFDCINKLTPILRNFQHYYFISLYHDNMNSNGLDNNKLFVLVKNGDEPIFKKNNKITIITPSCRPINLIKLKLSIDFEYVNEWIIVYDENKINKNPYLFRNEYNGKIKEYLHTSEGNTGNPQRNFALKNISNEDTILYYLDDDNIVHPNLFKILDIIDTNKFYTFNQFNRIKGNNINRGKIDTAMILIDYKLCKNIEWIKNLYDADGVYICECYNKNKDNHIFIDNDLCYYNSLR